MPTHSYKIRYTNCNNIHYIETFIVAPTEVAEV